MEQNQFIDSASLLPRDKKAFVNRQFSLKKLSQIARKDLKANSNRGLVEYLQWRPEYAFHEFHQNLMRRRTKDRVQIVLGSEQPHKEIQSSQYQAQQPDHQKESASASEQSKQPSTRSVRCQQHKSFRSSQLKQDQQLHPIKYKIVTSVLGISPEEVFRLKPADIRKAQQEYQKQKGKEYLQYSQKRIKPISRVKTEQITTEHNPQRSRTYVREIFRDLSEIKAKKQLKEQQAKHKIQTKLSKLQEHEQILGRVVYNKVKKHLRSEMGHKDFNRRVSSQESIDQALINFLKVRIKKAEVLAHQK